METRTAIIGQIETADIIHNGHKFSACGSSVNGRNVTGYEHKKGSLTRWDSAQLLPSSRYVHFETFKFINEFGDDAQAVGWRLRNSRWIVGYSLGNGMLFRGELITADDDDDARRQAISESEYWIERDREDAAQFEYEQSLEDDETSADDDEDPERFDGME